MKKITRLIGGLFNAATQGAPRKSDRSAGRSAAGLMGRAGRGADDSFSGMGDAGLEQLEARQMLFGLTAMPQPALAGALAFNNFALQRLGAANLGNGNNLNFNSIQFGYTVPILSGEIPAYQAPQEVQEDMEDEWNRYRNIAAAPTTPLARFDGTIPQSIALGVQPSTGTGYAYSFSGTGNTTVPNMLYQWRNFSTNNTQIPAYRVAPITVGTPPTVPAPTAATGIGLDFTLTQGAQMDLALVRGTYAGDRTVIQGGNLLDRDPQFNNVTRRAMVGANIDVFGQDLIDGVGFNSATTRLRLLFRGRDVTFDPQGNANFTLAQVAGPQPNDPAITTVQIRTVNGQAFDTVRLERIAATTDRIFISGYTGLEQPGRFAQFVQSRIFGAAVSGTASTRWWAQQFTGALTTTNPTPNVTLFSDNAPTAAQGTLQSNLAFVSNNGTPAPTVVAGALRFTLAPQAANQPRQQGSLQFRDTVSGDARVSTVFAFTNVVTTPLPADVRVVALRNGVRVPFTVGNEILYELSAAVLNDPANNFVSNTSRYTIVNPDGFDEIRFEVATAPAGASTTLNIDNIATVFANVLVEDLYGRSEQLTTLLHVSPGGTAPDVDLDDNGVPDFNDGIGRITLLGASGFRIGGGTLTATTDGTPPPVEFADSVQGIFAAFQTAQFGFAYAADGRAAAGLPQGVGSVIVGSPFLRDPRTAITYHGVNPVDAGITFPMISSAAVARPVGNRTGGFTPVNRPTPPAGTGAGPTGAFPTASAAVRATNGPTLNFTDQVLDNAADEFGAFTSDPANPLNRAAPNPLRGMGIQAPQVNGLGQSVGTIVVHGMLFGRSEISGSISTMSIGYLPGSINIVGDLGSLWVAGDAGNFSTANAGNRDTIVATGSRIDVGGYARQIVVSGRNLATIRVAAGQVPSNVNRLSFGTYAEQEGFLGTTGQPNPEFRWVTGQILSPTGIGAMTGANNVRNDDFASAEFVGGPTNAVNISGSLGQADESRVEDATDTYAFNARAGGNVFVSVAFQPPPASTQGRDRVYARIYDAEGNLVAASQYPFANPTDRLPSDVVTTRIRFTASTDGTYYLVLNGNTDGNNGNRIVYTATINGMAETSLGLASAASGARNTNLELSAGSIGLVRLGLGYLASDASRGFSGGIATTTAEAAGSQINDVSGLSLTTPGSIYSILIGADLEGFAGANVFNIGGNLGQMYVGVQGITPLGLGDMNTTTISVGGKVGTIFVAGSISNRTVGQSAPNDAAGPTGATLIQTGVSGDPGNINRLLVGGLINGSAFTLRTSDNSVIDQFIVGAIPGVGADDHGRIALFQPTIQMGLGSDIRYARLDTTTPFAAGGQQGRIAIGSPGSGVNEDAVLVFGFDGVRQQPITIEDDSGARITITLTGQSTGAVRVIPIASSRGVAIARLDLSLTLNATVTITSTGSGDAAHPGAIAIGQINVQSVGGARINLSGQVQIDVLELIASGAPLASISNTTVGGDMVTIDTPGLTTLDVLGNLGSTEMSGGQPWSPIFATRAGIIDSRGLSSRVGFIPINLNSINVQGAGGRVGGDVFTPVNWSAADLQAPTLEDAGGPVDTFLNGLIVRAGGINSVRVGGSVGDVIVPQGALRSLIANSNGTTPDGGFDGLVGNVYAQSIVTIDVGDGLAAPGDTPTPAAGIFSDTTITTITGGSRVRNPTISGLIIAAAGTGGIGTISLTSGRIDGAYIGAATFDSFWRSARFGAAGLNVSDQELPNGTINSVTLSNVEVIRTRFLAQGITTVSVTNGSLDATSIEARGVPGAATPLPGNIGTITAANIRNSTVSGEPLEYSFSTIRATGNVANIRTSSTTTGQISDTLIDVSGTITGEVATGNFVRAEFQVDNRITTIRAGNDVRGTHIVAGGLTNLTAGGDVRNTTLDIAGEIKTISTTGSITGSSITSSGPNGKITSITAGRDIDAQISSSGIIGTINATRGSFSGSVTTTNPASGTLTTLNAGVDILGNISISDSITTLTAGRHIGRRNFDGTTPDVISVSNNMTTVRAGGQLYSDLLIGQGITGSVSFGATVKVPSDFATDARIIAFGRIASVAVTGDFAGSILSHSGGIGSVVITNGSLVRAASGANSIEARDGDITTVSVVNGSVFGNIVARDGSINSVSVTGTGAFGNLGVNPNLSSATPVTGEHYRNQLPSGVVATAGIDGPHIWAGRDLSVTVAGSAFEAGIYAGGTVRAATISGSFVSDNLTDAVAGSASSAGYIAAGDFVSSVNIAGRARGLSILGGIARANADFSPSFGSDNAPGGTGAAADTVQAGRIGTVVIGGADSAIGPRPTVGNAPLVSQLLTNGGNPGGGSTKVAVSAGVSAGDDGIYATQDAASELAAAGVSTIASVSVGGPVVSVAGATFTEPEVRVVADSALTTLGGTAAASVDRALVSNVVPGTAFTGALPAGAGVVTIPTTGAATSLAGVGVQAQVRLTGTGVSAVYDSVNSRLVIIRTGAGTAATQQVTVASLIIEPLAAAPNAVLNNFNVITGDDVSITTVTVSMPVTGNSNLYVDGTVGTLTSRNLALTGGAAWRIGGDLTSATIGNTTANPAANSGWNFRAGSASSITLLGGLNGGSIRTDRNLGTLASRAAFSGLVSAGGDVSSVQITGLFSFGAVRSAGNITSVTATGTNQARVSARGNISTVTINGNMLESQVVAGVDLGDDGAFGGTGANADVVTNGNLTTLSITGTMQQSDAAAGVTRGSDGFFGSTEDVASDGHSTIGTVRATGGIIPTALQSQRYRVISNGTITNVYSGAAVVTAPIGNFKVTKVAATPAPLQVVSYNVRQIGGVFFATIVFNQDIIPSTIVTAAGVPAAITISEVRTGGQEFPLVAGLGANDDYRIFYDSATRTATIRFNTAVTNRSLTNNNAATPGADPAQALPSEGVFRFTLQAGLLRTVNQNGRLDGNNDGVQGDDAVFATTVGDAGDRLATGTAVNEGVTVNFYDPASLDTMMSSTHSPASTPVANQRFTVIGELGDHPDNNLQGFPSGSDIDLYSITLGAGQILRLSNIRGAASGAAVMLGWVDPATNVFSHAVVGDGGSMLLELPGSVQADNNTNTERSFVVLADGVLTVGIGFAGIELATAANPFANPLNPVQLPGFAQWNAVVREPAAGASGPYQFDVTVADDGNNGFAGTGSATAQPVVNSPIPSDFAGADNVLGTADDLPSISVGNWQFVLNAGVNGVLNGNGVVNGSGVVTTKSDDVVVGTETVFGQVIEHRASPNGLFLGVTGGDAVSITDAIGRQGTYGAPRDQRSDVDVFALNNNTAYEIGTRLRVTLRTSESGANFGQLAPQRFSNGNDVGFQVTDLRPNVKFALFDTTDATNITDAQLIASPTRTQLFGATPNTVLAQSANATYGYDSEGDFYMDFTVPPSMADANTPAKLAVYVQGVVESKYSVEIRQITNPGAAIPPTARATQYVFIETNGGQVNWLEAARTTKLAAYNPLVNGFAGFVGAQTMLEYILNGTGTATGERGLIRGLNDIFSNALNTGVTNFTAGQVIVTSDPTVIAGHGANTSTIYLTSSSEPTAFFNNGNAGSSQRSDLFNASTNDQAVVFMPAMNFLGNGVNPNDLNSFIRQLTVVVGARIGELLGLRTTNASNPAAGPVPNTSVVDAMGSFSTSAAGGVPVYTPTAGSESGSGPRFARASRALSGTQFFLGQQNGDQLVRRIFGIN